MEQRQRHGQHDNAHVADHSPGQYGFTQPGTVKSNINQNYCEQVHTTPIGSESTHHWQYNHWYCNNGQHNHRYYNNRWRAEVDEEEEEEVHKKEIPGLMAMANMSTHI
eukprot:425514-Karenia_brevis.AAC.1